MRPKSKIDAGQQELFRSRLDRIINLNHPLTRLAKLIDWQRLEETFALYYAEVGRVTGSVKFPQYGD